MMSMWPCIFTERESYFIWSLKTSSSQCHNNPFLVPPRKTPDTVKDIYDGHTSELKTRVDIWTSMDMVPVEYGTFAQTFNLKMWFLKFITGINFKWIMCCGVLLIFWYGLVFRPNWGFIECLQTHSDGLVKVLDIYCERACWVVWYFTRTTSSYLKRSN